jgi:hypothetical protein
MRHDPGASTAVPSDRRADRRSHEPLAGAARRDARLAATKRHFAKGNSARWRALKSMPLKGKRKATWQRLPAGLALRRGAAAVERQVGASELLFARQAQRMANTVTAPRRTNNVSLPCLT